MNLFLLAPPFFHFLSLTQMLYFCLSMQWKILPWCELPALGGSLADFVSLSTHKSHFWASPPLPVWKMRVAFLTCSDSVQLLQVVCYPHWNCVMWMVMASLTSSLSSLPWWMPVSWVSTAAPFHSSSCVSMDLCMFVLHTGRAPATANPLCCSFQSSLRLLFLWLVMLKIFITNLCSYTFWSTSCVCPYLILGQLHLFAFVHTYFVCRLVL